MPMACFELRMVYSSWWPARRRRELVVRALEARVKTHLTGSINDVTIIVDTLVVDGLVEHTLNGRVVGLDEVVLDELNDKRRLPCGWVRRDGGEGGP